MTRLIRTTVNQILDTQLSNDDLSVAHRFGKNYVLGSIINLCNIANDPSSDITDTELFSRILCLSVTGLDASIKNDIKNTVSESVS